MSDFFMEFAAIVALVLFIVALQKGFEYYFKRKLGDD